ncbi:MAG: mechanosensitive ion channel family protein [Gammaproteobacteria bacterium]|nr:mechanosensitive ion channel family protein [Gammaproteobacteria bacterium]
MFAQFILIDFKLDSWVNDILRFRAGVTTLLFIWFFWRYVGQIEHRLTHMPKSDPHLDINTVSIIGRFIRIAVGVIAVLISLEALGIPLSGVIAFGGGGAIVMGIAAQQLLANWFGGLMVFLDKPFKLGDWIQSPDRNIEGVVNRIGWRTTKVMTLDKRAMYIPNSLFNQIIIVNPQRMTHRRLNITVGVRYDDAMKIEDMVKSIKLMLSQNVHVDQDEGVLVHLVNFGVSSLDINIYCFTRVTAYAHWRDIQQNILFSVIKIINEHGAEFAYPTVTTHIPDTVTVCEGAHV